MLSAAAPRYEDALALLLTKSAEAVQEHVDAHGFGLVSQFKEQRVKPDDDLEFEKDSGSSTVTLDDCESLSDDETVSITSVGQAKRKSRRRIETRRSPAKTRPSTKAKNNGLHLKERRGRSRSRSPFTSPVTRTRSRSIRSNTSSSDSESGCESRYNHPPPPPPPPPSRRMPLLGAFGKPANSANIHPRPMPPGFPNFTAKYPITSALPPLPPPPPPPPPSSISCAPRYMTRPLSLPPVPPTNVSYPPGNNTTNSSSANNPPIRPHRFIPPPPPPPPPAPAPSTQPTQNQPQPQPKTHDIVLLIRWRHHSECRVLERLPLYAHSIQRAALFYIQRKPNSFEAFDPSASPRAPFAGLMAALRSVSVDGVVYNLDSWSIESSTVTPVDGGNKEADLTRIVEGLLPSTSSSSVIPVFEVEVWNQTPWMSKPSEHAGVGARQNQGQPQTRGHGVWFPPPPPPPGVTGRVNGSGINNNVSSNNGTGNSNGNVASSQLQKAASNPWPTETGSPSSGEGNATNTCGDLPAAWGSPYHPKDW